MKIHLIANAHIDPMWLWEWEDGCATAVSTFRTAADFCEREEGLVFNHNEALLYRWVEEYEPALFARIQKLVRAGKWAIAGGWYLQPDCNLPAGESIVRQMLSGYTYFTDRFGCFPKTAMNLDSFGHSRGLVKLLRDAGYEAYYICRPRSETNDMPLPDRFLWREEGGEQIPVIRDELGYGTGPEGTAKKIDRARARADGENVLCMWGIGDHGGGISRADYEGVKAYLESSDVPVVQSTFDSYAQALLAEEREWPIVETSLENCMTGCYTSQIRVKQAHRALEGELYTAEAMAAAAFSQGLIPAYPADELREAQEDLLLCEFHDVLPGSSVRAVEEAALRTAHHGMELLSRLRAKCFFALAGGFAPAEHRHYPIFVYTPPPYEVETLVTCEYTMAEQNWQPDWSEGMMTADGEPVPCQWEQQASGMMIDWQKRVTFRAKLRPSAMNRFDVAERRIPHRRERCEMPAGRNFCFDNGSFALTLDRESGRIVSLRQGGREFAAGDWFVPMCADDCKDPWGTHVKRYARGGKPFVLAAREKVNEWTNTSFDNDNVRVIEDGEVRTVVESLYVCGESRIVQRLTLPKRGVSFDLSLSVLWTHSDKFLKASLPLACGKTFERQGIFCRESFPADGREYPMQKYVLARDGTSALAVLNDGIGGCDALDGELRLSLLRSPSYASSQVYDLPLTREDAYVDRIDNGLREFRFRILLGEEAEVLGRVEREAELFCRPPFALCFFPSGHGRPSESLLELRGELVCTAVKRAEDGKGLIFRAYNSTGAEREAEVFLLGRNLGTVRVKPYGFGTWRCHEGRLTACNLFEQPRAEVAEDKCPAAGGCCREASAGADRATQTDCAAPVDRQQAGAEPAGRG